MSARRRFAAGFAVAILRRLAGLRRFGGGLCRLSAYGFQRAGIPALGFAGAMLFSGCGSIPLSALTWSCMGPMVPMLDNVAN
jgi:hypothetical protein